MNKKNITDERGGWLIKWTTFKFTFTFSFTFTFKLTMMINIQIKSRREGVG